MSPTSRTSHINPIQDIDTAHTVVMTALASCSTDKQKRAFEALNFLKETRSRKSRLIGLVQEALSQLRVDLKYLVFDLDATRKERDAYKEQLDKR